MKIVKIISTLMIIFLIISCSPKPKDAIIGDWKEPVKSGRFEFLQDGTFKYYIGNGLTPMSGTYKFQQDDVMIMNVQKSIFGSSTTTVKVKIKGNKLIMNLEDDTEYIRLERIP